MSANQPEACPYCSVNLVGEPIPEDVRGAYGHKTHFSRLIGISNGDRVMWFECPECRGRVERVPVPGPGGFRTFDVEVRYPERE
jgi:DNA-directed RNA polymerase subunit RPC12/RpoP